MNAIRRLRALSLASLAAAMAASIVGCAASPARAPVFATDDPAFVVTSLPPAPGVDSDPLEEIDAVRAGDVLAVRYVGSKDIEPMHVVIDRAGKVHLPLVGDVAVAGKSMEDAEQTIQDALRRYDQFSRASLELVEGKARIATVTGAVERPGNVPLVGDARVADVLGAVGGGKVIVGSQSDRTVPFGDLDGARLMRDGKQVPIDVRLAMEGSPRHNVRVHPGDILVVPPALDGRIVVLGQVNKPGTLPWRRGLRLTEVLADSGGLTKGADSEDIRILRGGYAHPKLYVANAKDVLAGVRPDVVLAQGDVVFVTEHWFASVGDVLDRIVPAAATAGLILIAR
jgi:polysaccharide export outer membrane protein